MIWARAIIRAQKLSGIMAITHVDCNIKNVGQYQVFYTINEKEMFESIRKIVILYQWLSYGIWDES